MAKNYYDDMPVWVFEGFQCFIAAAKRRDIPNGVSIALVLGRASQDALNAVAEAAAELSPTLVHCFGERSEVAHDVIDATLARWPDARTMTYWTDESTPTEVIFEFFVTDLPAESEFERWSGRLLVLDDSLCTESTARILQGLTDVDGAIRTSLRDTSRNSDAVQLE